jgi:hypothetical protein
MGGVQNSLINYGVGIGAGLLYNLVAGFTGSGLIGGALSAGITGAAVRGVAGEMVAVSSGFAVGQSGLAGLGLGGLMPQVATDTAAAPQFELL